MQLDATLPRKIASRRSQPQRKPFVLPIPVRADFDPWILFLGLLTFLVAVWSAWRREADAAPAQLGGWITLKGGLRIGGYLPRNLAELSVLTALAYGVAGAVTGQFYTLLIPLGAFMLALSLRQTMGWRLSLPGMAWLLSLIHI